MSYPQHMYTRNLQAFRRRTGRKVSMAYRNQFGKESGVPDWLSTPGVYLSNPASDKSRRMDLDRIALSFRLARNASLTVNSMYYSRNFAAQVFAAAGLGSVEDAMNYFNFVFLDRLTIWSSSKKELSQNLGPGFHNQQNLQGRQTMILASIACQGSFQGERGWDLFSQILVQGGWPLLGHYSKHYAKNVYIAMVCLFCCVRHGQVGPEIGPLILALATKVVDMNWVGGMGLVMRIADNIVDEIVIYEPVRQTDGILCVDGRLITV
jgi:hypothetical protein